MNFHTTNNQQPKNNEKENNMANNIATEDKLDLTKPLPRGAIPATRAELAAATPHVLAEGIGALPLT